MNTSVEKIPTARFADGKIYVEFSNGVDFSFPVAGNERLEGGTPEQLNNIEVDGEGLHWPDLNEDLSFEGLMHGEYGQYVHRMKTVA